MKVIADFSFEPLAVANRDFAPVTPEKPDNFIQEAPPVTGVMDGKSLYTTRYLTWRNGT